MTPAGATVPGLGPMSLGGWTSKVERCVCMCVCACACACAWRCCRVHCSSQQAQFLPYVKSEHGNLLNRNDVSVCFIKYIHFAHLLIKTMTGQIK